MKTAVVILNWNGLQHLQHYLPRVVAATANADIVVADNGSTDESVEWLRREMPFVSLILLDKNYGFTGGYNRAFEQIDSDLFVLINSDIEVTEDWLGPLVDWMDRHPECGACAPKLHSWQERDKFEYAGAAGGYIDRFGYPFCRGRIMKRLETDYGQYDSPADVFWATGACLMVRSSLYRELGGLDERFFAHMEEIDLCWRMQLAGYNVTVIPDSKVYHVGGGTLPAASPFKLYLNFRNNLMMLENNLSKTFALSFLKQGMRPVKAAVKGIGKARRRIALRKCLDGLSAAVYLLTFRTDCFKSVWKAHKDASTMVRRPSVEDICRYLETSGGKVKGIYGKWIILRSLLMGDKVSGSIKEKDFYKI